MGHRRDFLKKLGILSLASIAAPLRSSAFAPSLPEIPASTSGNDAAYWNIIRRHFDIRDQFIYLNNGTMGPSPIQVQRAFTDEIQYVNKSLHYGGGKEVRGKIADFINAETREISITHNTTEGINIAAWAIPLKKGDEIIMTSQEHVGNAMPWLNRAKIDGIVVRTFHPSSKRDEVLNQIDRLINKKTRVIAIPHISCTIGQLFPIKEVVKLCRDKGLWSMIDGAHGPGSMPLDMRSLDADFYAGCGHKWMLGPKGTGFVFVNKRVLDGLIPRYAGAYSDKGYDITQDPAVLEGYSDTAHRFDYGTQSSALKIGIGASIDFLNRIGMDRIEERIFSLNEYAYQQLLGMDHIEMLSSAEKQSRSMMCGFRVKNMDFQEVFNKLAEQNIRIRVVPESNLDSVRLSTHIYNNEEQLDVALEAIRSLR